MELQNTMERMEAGLYTLVETQLDTTSPIFCKFMKNTITKEGIYVDIELISNRDDIFRHHGSLMGLW